MSTTPEVQAAPTDEAPPLDDLARELLDGLDAIDGLPVAGHMTVFEAVHDRMRAALTTRSDGVSTPPSDASS